MAADGVDGELMQDEADELAEDFPFVAVVAFATLRAGLVSISWMRAWSCGSTSS